jgi:tripartite motif-containing protein 71
MSFRIRRILYTSAADFRFIVSSKNPRLQRWQVVAVLTTKIIIVTTVATCCHKLYTTATLRYSFARNVGDFGSGNGQFNSPSGIAVDPPGNVWVADTYNNRIQEFTSEGQFVQAFGMEVLSLPHGVAIDPSGNVWVADTFGHRVVAFTTSGTLLRTFGALGSEDGQFRYPIGIAADSAGNIWIADSVNNRIQEFTTGGAFIRKFGSLGCADGQFLDPHCVAADTEGNVWVADDRIQEFTSTGAFLQALVTDHNRPVGIALDSSGNIWATSGSCVLEFTSSGSSILDFGSQGTENGQLSRSKALAVDSHGNVWVADTGNNRIVKFSPITAPKALVPAAVAISLLICFFPIRFGGALPF